MSENKENVIDATGGIFAGGETKTREEYDKEAGKCNLYRDICNMFEEEKHSNPEAWAQGRLDEEALSEYPMSFQRLIANRALRLKLGQYPHDTRDQRYILIDEGSYEDWKDYVRTVVSHIVNEDKKQTTTS